MCLNKKTNNRWNNLYGQVQSNLVVNSRWRVSSHDIIHERWANYFLKFSMLETWISTSIDQKASQLQGSLPPLPPLLLNHQFNRTPENCSMGAWLNGNAPIVIYTTYEEKSNSTKAHSSNIGCLFSSLISRNYFLLDLYNISQLPSSVLTKPFSCNEDQIKSNITILPNSKHIKIYVQINHMSMHTVL